MRLNLAVLAISGATMLAGIACGEVETPTEESADAPITVTEMTLLPDGTWKTTSSRTIPRGPTFQPDVGDGVEARQSALYVVPCTNSWQVALWKDPNYGGNTVLCLNTNGSTQPVYFGWAFSARSVYTVTPIKLYDANNNLVFYSCTTSGKGNGALSPAGTTVQEHSIRSAICSL